MERFDYDRKHHASVRLSTALSPYSRRRPAHRKPRIQVNNTLAAQVDLAGRATVVRKRRDGTIITDKDELIACSRYGNPNRNSDPEARFLMVRKFLS